MREMREAWSGGVTKDGNDQSSSSCDLLEVAQTDFSDSEI